MTGPDAVGAAAQGRTAIQEPNRTDPMTAPTVVMVQPVASSPNMRSALQAAEEKGLTFAGTPGPGYSEGGDVHEPKAAKT